jgi:CheY-like chemotaxis protein
VWVYSELGHGTTMHVYLPAASAPDAKVANGAPKARARSRAGSPSHPDRSAHNGTTHSTQSDRHAGWRGEHAVLVIDDESALRAAAVRALRDAGYRVLDAESEEHALALAREGPLDVVLTDVIMPSLDGVAVAERILRQQPDVRVIYMSGYPKTHLVSTGRLRGSHAFIAKPFTTLELCQAVDTAAHRTRGKGVDGNG